MRSIALRYIVIALVASLVCASMAVQPVYAAQLTSMSDQLDRLNENTVSAHTIYFVTPTGVAAGQTITVTFPGSSFVFGGSYSFADMSLAEGNTNVCSTATFTGKTLGSTPAGTTWGATYSTNVVTFTSGTGTVTADRCVRIILSSNGAGHTLTNPAVGSNTSYKIDITAGTSDSGSLAVIVVDDPSTPDGDQIQIDASVDNSLSFDVDIAVTSCNNSTETTSTQNRINLGTLTPATVKKSNSTIQFICIDFTTNSANGGSVFVQSARANASGGLVRIGTSDTIASATADLNSGAVSQGYGVRVVDTGTPAVGSFTISAPFNSATSGSVGLIPGTSASADDIVTATVPVQTGTSDRIEVELAAKAGVNTPAGIYTDTLTFTATANF